MGRAFEYRRAAKEKRWDKMSKIFPKLSKAITLAAKEGGGDPEMNAKLRTAIQNAKAENMPKDNIESAIKRATNKDVDSFTQVNYEGKGPHGALIFVECATDNTTRTVANVKYYFNKFGLGMVPTGSLEFMFSRKAVFEFAADPGINMEELEFNLIDAGLDSIETEGDRVYVYGDYTHFGSLDKALRESGVEVQKASLQRIPTSPITLTEEQMTELEVLLDKIEEDDDVQAVYTNIE
ncbi:MAG: YebC/PmpR family DNA-binding transcriptional regulator [Bacteroidia bacterium]|nr:YebC/PmpR family DNA-binding transcriptional regulator [Bacteroidia bacterium]